MKILNLLTIIDKKHPLYVFYFYLKLQNLEIVGLFYPTGTMSRRHTFEKRQCDRCWYRSAVKNMPPPSLSFPVPIPPHPSANCPGPMISGLLDPVTSSANGVASLVHSIGIHSVPRPSPPPAQCRQNRLFQWRKRSLTLGRVRIHDMARNVSGKNRHSS
jgi:hypothetical protein